jgi:hypothetical protein
MPMYDANEILKRVKDPDKDKISDKMAGKRLRSNERVVRDARLGMVKGGVRTKDNTFLVDRLCVRGLGLHPAAVFGYAEWVLPGLESITPEDEQEIREFLDAP